MALKFEATSKFLFIGDSITDCGRREDPEHLGHGYVRFIREWLLARDPATAPQVINRGISGNKVTDLAARWQQDVIALEPDVLTVKIGINDVWHGLGGRSEGVPVDVFQRTYHEILALTQHLLPNCKIVLFEPSVIWPPQPVEGNGRLQPYIAAVHELAEKLNLDCGVPLHGIFEDAKAAAPAVKWAPDGVHPSSAGHMLIARAWLETTGLL